VVSKSPLVGLVGTGKPHEGFRELSASIAARRSKLPRPDWWSTSKLWLSGWVVERQGLNRYSGGEKMTKARREKDNWTAESRGKVENV